MVYFFNIYSEVHAIQKDLIMGIQFLLIIAALCNTVLAQTKEAYETDNATPSQKGFLDPSHFTINNSVSFGMTSSLRNSDLKSQSLYSTMLQYKFNAPVTVHFNVGLPIYSTISSAQNLNQSNLQSMEYFKNMPLSASIAWQPTENMSLYINFERNTYGNYFYGNTFPGLSGRSVFEQPAATTKEMKKVEKK
jgi:hypothetical protein